MAPHQTLRRRYGGSQAIADFRLRIGLCAAVMALLLFGTAHVAADGLVAAVLAGAAWGGELLVLLWLAFFLRRDCVRSSENQARRRDSGQH